MKSPWVKWGRDLVHRDALHPPADYKPGVCTECDGLGVVPMELDPERYAEMVPCQSCNEYCPVCRTYFRRGTGHHCKGAKPWI